MLPPLMTDIAAATAPTAAVLTRPDFATVSVAAHANRAAAWLPHSEVIPHAALV